MQDLKRVVSQTRRSSCRNERKAS